MTDHRPVVLVVDDDQDLRILAQIQLGERFDVLVAGSGEEALALARTRPVDVILLDIMMPGMDGVQVMHELSSDPSTSEIPVIFLSALTSTEEKVRSLESGAVDYISKPADPQEFIARVAAAARTRARHEDLKRTQSGDPTTGLPHRAAFEDRLAQEVARSRRTSTPLTIFIADIDGLDGLNAALGRRGGDQLLQQIGESMVETLRASDMVYRYGGDEFAAILPEAEAGTAVLAAERCRAAARSLSPNSTPITLSVGIAEVMPGRSAEELLAKAEIALFRAKESGGDRLWRSDDPRRHGLNPTALAEELTEREWTVLRMLADRRTEQDIARQMGIRPGTVRSHKARIRRKLNVSPEMRLIDFVRNNFRDLIARIGEIDTAEERADL